MKKIIEQCFKEFVRLGIDKPRNRYEIKSNVGHAANILRLLPKKQMRCLELGIGRGYLALIMKRVLGYKVYGVDHPSRNFLKEKGFKELVKKEGFGLKNVDITKKKLGFKDGFFDVVVFSETIEHLEPRKLGFVLGEVRRVLKRDGLFLLTTINRKRLANLFVGRKNKDSLYQYEGTHGHIKEYTLRELLQLLKENGLRPVRVKMSNFSYLNPFIDFVNNFVCFFFPRLCNDVVILAQNFKNS